MSEAAVSYEAAIQDNRRRFSPGLTLAASLAATVGFNAAIGHGDMPVITHSAYDIVSEPYTVTVDGSKHVEIRDAAGGPEIGSAETTLHQILPDAIAPWAERFARDGHALVVDQSSVESTAKEIATAKQQGKKDIMVNLTGLVSAEDDLVGVEGQETAGMIELSDKNAQLGTVRSMVYAAALTKELQKMGIDGVAINIQRPREQFLQKDQLLVARLLAAQFGYRDVQTMVQQWNRTPQKTPPAVDEFFDRILKPNRGVAVSLDTTVESEQAQPANKQEKVCVFTRTIRTSTTTTHVPAFDEPYFIPMPVPIFRKRHTKAEPEPKEEPIPEADDIPEETVIVDPPIAPEQPEPVTPEPDPTVPDDGEPGVGGPGGGAGSGRSHIHGEKLPRPGFVASERFKRMSGRLLLAGLLVGAGVLWKDVEFKGESCWINIDKQHEDWLPDVDLHWDCHMPKSTKPKTLPTPPKPVDPCAGADRDEITIVNETYSDGKLVDHSDGYEGKPHDS